MREPGRWGVRRVGFPTTRDGGERHAVHQQVGAHLRMGSAPFVASSPSHPANAVAGCIWYTVLGLSGLIYFLSRIQDDTAHRQAPAPAEDPSPSASLTSSPKLLASVPSSSGQPWPEEWDSQ